MNISQWAYWVLTVSTYSSACLQYSTKVFPEFIPGSSNSDYAVNVPCYIYQQVGWNNNKKEKKSIISFGCIANSKANAENMNDDLYTIFDTSTNNKRTQFSVSTAAFWVTSVDIVNNEIGVYDEDNHYWTRWIDVAIWYRN